SRGIHVYEAPVSTSASINLKRSPVAPARWRVTLNVPMPESGPRALSDRNQSISPPSLIYAESNFGTLSTNKARQATVTHRASPFVPPLPIGRGGQGVRH